ncbi:histidine--tRNA ligase [Thermoproteus tenax]|uniref:Histidine--tRNA ligase n=1 Tax=Thermoproteus tenax (strain ATCC 35583 / DSM 2078 / JCM 9277 / NBRC 100435 / Kra 1) TaxID=768679 RepID=G4RPG7_THETK|nr:histidine--tRNA ligase [Thermoproteus tenax]CCC81462.1 Histidyl-tRNA synthetase [Thermoproteus tenax Kra 1]
MPGLEDFLRKPVRGMRDLAPDDFYPLKRMEELLSALAESFGYRRIETPAVEHFEVLSRKAGREIVNEIYYFRDKAGREVGLRFDMTVPVARVLSYKLEEPKPVRWYYFTKVWRYDEPQHGRYREFYQFGVELVGSESPRADAEVIALMSKALEAAGARSYEIRLNDRVGMDKILETMGIAAREEVLRILDKKGKVPEEELKALLKKAGLEDEKAEKLLELVSEPLPMGESAEFFSKYDERLGGKYAEIIKALEPYDVLDKMKLDLAIVRGLDYYTGTVFEAFVGEYKLAVGGGGRYDNLIELFSGIKTPALGFAIGVERLMEALNIGGSRPPLDYYIYPMTDEAYKVAVKLASMLREKGASVAVDLGELSLKEALEHAAKTAVKFFVIIGKKEIEKGVVKIRDMYRRTETEVELSRILRY